MRRRTVLPVVLALVTALATAPAARADGDPASDVLLSQDAFYPYQPNLPSKGAQAALNKMLREARRKGYPLKVAIIKAITDLGSVPQMLSQPQPYADLLTREISYNEKPRVLVVLNAGLGGNNLGAGAGPALQGLAPDPGGDSDSLVRTAMQAVRRLTVAAGKPVALPAIAAQPASTSGGGGGGTSPLLVFGLPVALVVAAAALAALRGRGREDEGPEAE